jgi:uncharacterized membrane protein YeaQ/YmgE (transglycosylase-associated protein family)
LAGVVGAIVLVLVAGFVIGALARLAVPGPDPMPFWLTILIGLGGSVVGGGVAAAIFGASNIFESSGRVFVTLLLEIAAAAAIVGGYRRFVQQRPLAGADARRFPTRGVGVGRMRERLRALGIDPDRLARGGTAPRPADRSADDVAEELARLRDLRDKGVLTDEEYERERERLRRY